MPRIRIYQHDSVDEEALIKLLEEAGCHVPDAAVAAEAEFGSAEGKENTAEEEGFKTDEDGGTTPQAEVCDPEVIVMVLTPAVCGSADVEHELKAAANGRCRVVGIWPSGSGGGVTLPDAFRKYGASEVSWSPAEVGDVICGRRIIHRDSSGAARPAVTTDRNCC